MIDAYTKKWLGAQAQDTTTGYKGFVAAIDYHLSGTVQLTLQPPVTKKEPGTLPPAYSIDVEVMKLIKAAPKAKTVFVDTEVSLGDEVEDTISGKKGTVTIFRRCHNGCVTLIVEPRIEKKVDYKMFAVDSKRLDVTKPAKVPQGRQEAGPGPGCLHSMVAR